MGTADCYTQEKHRLMVTDSTQQTLLVLHLRHDFESVPDHQIIQNQLCQAVGCVRVRVRNWREFAESVKEQRPALITIHHAELARAGYSNTAAFGHFVQGIVNCMGYNCCRDQIPLLIGIDDSCSRQFVSGLMSAPGVCGIYPAESAAGDAALIQAHRVALAGRVHWPREVIDRLPKIKRDTVRPVVDSATKLTVRQQEVMDLICHRGLSNKQIARTLNLSESTVKIHVSAIMKAHGVRNRTQLVLSAGPGIRA